MQIVHITCHIVAKLFSIANQLGGAILPPYVHILKRTVESAFDSCNHFLGTFRIALHLLISIKQFLT